MTARPHFTPGPWMIKQCDPDGRVHEIRSANGWLTADVYDEEALKPGNANLIAAAPDLYAALSEWLEIAEANKQYLGATGRRVRAALAKARGEEVAS